MRRHAQAPVPLPAWLEGALAELLGAEIETGRVDEAAWVECLRAAFAHQDAVTGESGGRRRTTGER